MRTIVINRWELLLLSLIELPIQNINIYRSKSNVWTRSSGTSSSVSKDKGMSVYMISLVKASIMFWFKSIRIINWISTWLSFLRTNLTSAKNILTMIVISRNTRPNISMNCFWWESMSLNWKWRKIWDCFMVYFVTCFTFS